MMQPEQPIQQGRWGTLDCFCWHSAGALLSTSTHDLGNIIEPTRRLQFSLRSLVAAVVFAAVFSAIAIADYQDSRWFSLQYPRPFYVIWLIVSAGTLAYIPRAKRLGILAPTALFLAASLLTLLAHFFII